MVITVKYLLFFGTLLVMQYSDCQTNNATFTSDELIGKRPPELYGTDFRLQKEAYLSFIKMQKAALKDGIKIKVISSFRSYNQQNDIWEDKFKTYTKNGLTPIQAINKIIEYSTIPGTSRHHWATEVDIVDGNINPPDADVLQTKFFDNPKVYLKLKLWLKAHANKYEFYLVYTDDNKRKGFKYEPWHYSYAPLSKPMLKAYLKLDLNKILDANKLLGSKYLTPKFLNNYKKTHIMGINNYLKPTTHEKN